MRAAPLRKGPAAILATLSELQALPLPPLSSETPECVTTPVFRTIVLCLAAHGFDEQAPGSRNLCRAVVRANLYRHEPDRLAWQ